MSSSSSARSTKLTVKQMGRKAGRRRAASVLSGNWWIYTFTIIFNLCFTGSWERRRNVWHEWILSLTPAVLADNKRSFVSHYSIRPIPSFFAVLNACGISFFEMAQILTNRKMRTDNCNQRRFGCGRTAVNWIIWKPSIELNFGRIQVFDKDGNTGQLYWIFPISALSRAKFMRDCRCWKSKSAWKCTQFRIYDSFERDSSLFNAWIL